MRHNARPPYDDLNVLKNERNSQSLLDISWYFIPFTHSIYISPWTAFHTAFCLKCLIVMFKSAAALKLYVCSENHVNWEWFCLPNNEFINMQHTYTVWHHCIVHDYPNTIASNCHIHHRLQRSYSANLFFFCLTWRKKTTRYIVAKHERFWITWQHHQLYPQLQTLIHISWMIYDDLRSLIPSKTWQPS